MLGKIDQLRLQRLCELVAACAFISGCGGGSNETATASSAGSAGSTSSTVAAPAPSTTAAPSPAPAVVATGLPSYASATALQPGWISGTFAVGQVITADFGVPANGASSYSYACYRNGNPISGASGTTSSEFQSYTIVSADLGTVLSCQVTPTNSYGAGAAQIIAGLYVNA